MDLPTQPVTLQVPQVEDLARHFASFRHDVNGCLALVVAATELIRYNPDLVKRMATPLVEQPPKIAGKVREFVEQCERTLGLRAATEAAWYPALWKRANLAAGQPANPVSLTPEKARSLHNEVMQLGKDLTQLGFLLSGTRALGTVDAMNAAEAMLTVAEQFTKAAVKFDQMATQFESAMQINEAAERRHIGGSPAGPVTFTPGQLALFHRQLKNFQNDMHGHLTPLLELSRLARQRPKELQTRAGEFAHASPNISKEMTNFATEFERTFCIVRGAHAM